MGRFFTYILKCSDDSYYAGHTDNLEARISQHQQGLIAGCYTLNRRPITLIWMQNFETREAAFIAERKIKKWSRQKKDALIRGDWAVISELCSRKKKI